MTDFNRMRIQAMVSRKDSVLRAQEREAQWADYGLRISEYLQDKRFQKAVRAALDAGAHGAGDPVQRMADVLRTYLTTGVIPK